MQGHRRFLLRGGGDRLGIEHGDGKRIVAEVFARHGLHFELQTPWWHLHEAARLASDFPDLPIVLNQFLPAFLGLFGIEISTAGVSHAELMIFGALIVWFLIVEPHGLAKLWSTAKQKLRLWPFPH